MPLEVYYCKDNYGQYCFTICLWSAVGLYICDSEAG